MPNDKSKKPPDLFQVSMSGSTFYIGMDLTKNKPVITDRNPNLEGLVDIHRCIYLPSAYEKNKNPLENSAQVIKVHIPILRRPQNFVKSSPYF